MMTILYVALLVLFGLGLPALWLWWTNHQVKNEYRAKWDDLNRRVGGILPDYDKMRKG